MYSSLTREIICYSIVPASIIAIIIFILLYNGKKKNNNLYKFNGLTKVLLSILIIFILLMIIGYTILVYKKTIALGNISSDIIFMILLAVVVISLFAILITMFIKLYKNISNNK